MTKLGFIGAGNMAGALIKGLIAAGDLSPIKARVLLMLALAQGLRGPDLERVFREY